MSNKYEYLSFQEPFHSSLFKEPSGYSYPIEYGCILAICSLVDCVPTVLAKKAGGGALLKRNDEWIELPAQELAFGDYAPGRFAWILKDVHRLADPIPAKGRQRLWNWDATEHLTWFDPYVVGSDRIWTPRGIITGRVAPEGIEDAVQGLRIMIVELQPKTFVMEEVPAIVNFFDPDGIPVLDKFAMIISDGGYGTWENIKKGMMMQSGCAAGVKSMQRGNARIKSKPIHNATEVQSSLF